MQRATGGGRYAREPAKVGDRLSERRVCDIIDSGCGDVPFTCGVDRESLELVVDVVWICFDEETRRETLDLLSRLYFEQYELHSGTSNTLQVNYLLYFVSFEPLS